jgi:hypothetical protein
MRLNVTGHSFGHSQACGISNNPIFVMSVGRLLSRREIAVCVARAFASAVSDAEFRRSIDSISASVQPDIVFV